MTTARYDGQAEWYESFAAAELFVEARAAAVRLLGDGSGRCLDLGCGTGRAIPLLAAAGWRVTGVDVSRDQLRVAERHAVTRKSSSAPTRSSCRSPTTRSTPSCRSSPTRTSTRPLRGFSEARRVLRPGCPSSTSESIRASARPRSSGATVSPRCCTRSTGVPVWQTESRNFSETGIRSRVGINHAPLAAFLNALLASGFVPVEFEEPGELDPPLFLAVRATGSCGGSCGGSYGRTVSRSSSGSRSLRGGSLTFGPRWISATICSDGSSPRIALASSDSKAPGVRQ